MSRSHFQRPEAALKRAEELIAVGKEQDALDVLHDTIKARRHKQQWSQTHEDIMMMHVGLCVTLRKPQVCKDALFQYKALSQTVAVTSLEKVLTHVLDLARKRAEEAQKSSIDKVEEIDDLDSGDNPEHLLLSVVSGHLAQDRMDRTVLAPWLRFMWDSYRNSLELLRNNHQVEGLYNKIAQASLDFCLKYQRRAEFRKLTDLLRGHLMQIQRQQHLAHGVKLNSPESLTLLQETRLKQLNTAIQMELYQEAFRSAEDVHGIMQLSKDKDRRMVRPAICSTYYTKLAVVFWKAGNYLFHAAALLQKFTICKDLRKNWTPEEARELATAVLLAILSIPEGADHPSLFKRALDLEMYHGVNMRVLSNLLDLAMIPSRASLLREAARQGIIESADETVVKLYDLMEMSYSPNQLSKKAADVLTVLQGQPESAPYTEALQYSIAVKVLNLGSRLYQVMSWAKLRRLLPSFGELELEFFLAEVSKMRLVKFAIDHRNGQLNFDEPVGDTLAGGFDESDHRSGHNLRTHLEVLYTKLQDFDRMFTGEKKREEAVERIKRLVGIYKHHKDADSDRFHQRRVKIERNKEAGERQVQELKAQADRERQQRAERQRQEDKIRLEKARKDQELRRKEAEKDEVEKKIRMEKMRKLLQSSLYKDVLSKYTEDELANMDPEEIMREQRIDMDNKRQATQKRLEQQDRKFDHTVRADHIEEAIQRRARDCRRQETVPKLFNAYEERRIAKIVAAREFAVNVWGKLQTVADEANAWMAKVKADRAGHFEAKMNDFKEKLKAVREDRLAARALARREERRRQWQQDRIEAEARRKKEEEMQREQLQEEQRRAARGDRPDHHHRRERDDEPSRAMADDNWRAGGGESIVRRVERERERDFGGDRDRQRPSMAPREPRQQPTAPADADNAWRAGARPQAARHPEPPRHALDSHRREPVHHHVAASVADTEDKWARGNVVKRQPPPTSAPPPDPAPSAPVAVAPPAAPKKSAYVPPQRRQAMAAAQPAPVRRQEEEVDAEGFTTVKTSRGPPRSTPTPPAPSSSSHEPPRGAQILRRPPGGPAKSADADSDWRK
ncbi:unnamed protein product, partial [Mesorhabditis spiculigera]